MSRIVDVKRDGTYDRLLQVYFDRALTDDEMRAFDDFIRGWNGNATEANDPGDTEEGEEMALRWTPELRQRFRTAWLEGMTVSEICERFATSKGHVHRLRKEMGLPVRKPGCGGGRPKKEPVVVTLPATMTKPLPESSIPWPDKARLMAGR